MTTRAKFSCTTKTQTPEYWNIGFEPVRSGSEENRTFFKFTPGGRIDLQIVGSDTAQQFKVGHDYYIDFIEAEEVSNVTESQANIKLNES